MSAPKGENLTWHVGEVDKAARTAAHGHRGAVLWFTGLSGSGKSTIGHRVERMLIERGAFAYVLDGDNIRHSLNSDLGFAPEDRVENIRRIGEVARLFADAGALVVSAFISPYRKDRDRIRGLMGKGEFVEVFVDKLRHYMSIKTLISLFTGAFIGLSLWLIGVDYPILWAVLAFMLNFVPNIGSIIAAVPAVLLTIVQLGVPSALLVAAVYTAVNIIIGSFVEPKFMGKGLGLSTLVVFVSLVFWGWVLGPVGMLLSVPLTITVKLALDINPETRWLGHLLGPVDEPVDELDEELQAEKA